MRKLEKIQYKIYEAINPLLFSPFYIKNIDKNRQKYTSKKISVAIPHYNRGKEIHITLKNILKDTRINEIVVLDDGSSPDEFNYLVKNLSRFAGKIKLFRRDQNIGAFETKIQVVSLCSNEWLILLDSDNTIFPEYIDAIFSLPNWAKDRIYCPNFAYPHFNFRALSGEIIDFKKCSTLDLYKYGPFMNDGNYFVNKMNYLNSILPYKNVKIFLADVIFANYIWLSEGNNLEVLHNASYFHRVHAGSTWLKTMHESSKNAEFITGLLVKGIKADQNNISKFLEISSNEWVEPTLVSLGSR
jgi:glycosyltransferase involved in cell wall biosynthesis